MSGVLVAALLPKGQPALSDVHAIVIVESSRAYMLVLFRAN